MRAVCVCGGGAYAFCLLRDQRATCVETEATYSRVADVLDES